MLYDFFFIEIVIFNHMRCHLNKIGGLFSDLIIVYECSTYYLCMRFVEQTLTNFVVDDLRLICTSG